MPTPHTANFAHYFLLRIYDTLSRPCLIAWEVTLGPLPSAHCKHPALPTPAAAAAGCRSRDDTRLFTAAAEAGTARVGHDTPATETCSGARHPTGT